MKKRSIISFILVLVLVITIPCSVFIYRALTKEDDTDPNTPGGGSSASAVSQVIHAVEEVADRNYEIIRDYSKNDSSDADNYAAVLDVDKLNDYFNSFGQTIVVPAAFDYVFKSAGSGVYQNSFKLGQTYFSRETNGKNEYIYYFKAEKEGSLVNLYCGDQDNLIICQVEYDFENDRLITAKTITNGVFAIVDYEANYYTFAQFKTDKPLQDVLDGNFSYDDITTNASYEKMYTGNIAKNINSIDFEMFEFDGSQTSKNVFNNYIERFEMDIDCENIFEYSKAVVNNSFIGAMEYSTRRLGYFEIVEKNYEYIFYSYWINYEEIVTLLERLKNSEYFAGDENSNVRAFLNSYKNYLVNRGEAAYTGDCTYSFRDDMISVTKAGAGHNVYVVTIYINGEAIEISCQLTSNSVDVEENAQYITTNFSYVVRGETGSEYVVITNVSTTGSIINIPETMEVEGYAEPLPVKKLGQQSTSDYFYINSSNYRTLVLNIPAYIEEFYNTSWFDVAAINVEEGSEYLYSDNGVLYTADKETLIRYPAYSSKTSYDILPGTKHIEDGAFQGVENLVTINIPNSLVSGIETNTFWASFTIENIQINSNSVYTSYNGIVYTADGKELIMCPAGKKGVVAIKNGTEIIRGNAFGYCKFLTEIIIPDTVTEIGAIAFHECEALKTLNIPNSVTEIDRFESSFRGVLSLENLNIEAGSTLFYVDANGFVYSYDKTSLYFCPRNYEGKVTIASTVTRIESSAFYGCSRITEVVVHEGVTYIGDYAFTHSSASKITILGSVALDGGTFFRSSLQEIHIEGFRNLESYNHGATWYVFDETQLVKFTFGGTKAEFEAGMSDYYDFNTTGLKKLVVECEDGDLVYTRTNN